MTLVPARFYLFIWISKSYRVVWKNKFAISYPYRWGTERLGQVFSSVKRPSNFKIHYFIQINKAKNLTYWKLRRFFSKGHSWKYKNVIYYRTDGCFRNVLSTNWCNSKGWSAIKWFSGWPFGLHLMQTQFDPSWRKVIITQYIIR